MTSTLFPHLCQITACSSNSLFNDRQYNNIVRSLYHNRTRSLTRRNRQRRTPLRGPSTPSISRRRRRQALSQLTQASYKRSLQRHVNWPKMAFQQPRYRGSLDRTFSLDAALAAAKTGEIDAAAAKLTAAEQPLSAADPQSDTDSMPPPPPPGETLEVRPKRSTSSASRQANRLSLTLPIAPPNSMPSRPAPTPSSSVPQTPVETPSATTSPGDPNELITVIATQERRVLELREELKHAEGELLRLKTNYSTSDEYRKRNSTRRPAGLRPAAAISTGHHDRSESPSARHGSDMDRRKAYLLGQSQSSPREARRTIISGGHTRALSLLSPTKPSEDVQIFKDQDVLSSPETVYSPTPNPRPGNLSKRATWAPRQYQPQQPPGVRQLATDFRQGLWTFVEDLRQATVGEEGISGSPASPSESTQRLSRVNSDQDTIRASAANRGRIPFETEPESSCSTPSRSNSGSFEERVQHRRTTSKPEPKARKHFSWTPLTFDQVDGDDWSNWDSPNVKTSRWSGSTVNGDIIPAIPERPDENENSLRIQVQSPTPPRPQRNSKRSRSALRSESPSPTASKLDEMPQALLNRLTPSNFKKSANDFLKEWERSLSPPNETTPFDNTLGAIHISDREM